MTHALLPASGNFYKANLHTHSTYSDGEQTVEQIKELYMSRGYSVVAFTDHDVMIDQSHLNEDEKFLALTSYEIYTNNDACGLPWSKMPCYHLNLYAKDPHETYYPCANPRYAVIGHAREHVQDYYKGDYTRRYSVEGQNEMIAEARAHGFLVSYNHACWSLQHYPDYIGLEGVTAVEVFNSGCVLGGYTLDASEHVLDDMLHAGKRVYPVAGDDSHDRYGCCWGWVRFKAPSLTYDNIMTAYEKGDFYASWGPDISSLVIEDGIVKLDCTGAVKISLQTDGRWCAYITAPAGETVDHWEVDVRHWLREARALGITDKAYIRLTLTDAAGNLALTRGYFADEMDDIEL